MAGIGTSTIKELAGHKTLQMTLRYSHLSQEHKQQAVDILAQRLGTKRTFKSSPENFQTEEKIVIS